MDLTQVELALDFQDPSGDRQKQETLTQQLFQQMHQMSGVTVERVEDPNPPGGARGAAFLWGLLQAEVSVKNLKNLGKFLGDRLGDKTITIKAKFPDGREYEVQASSQAELGVAMAMIAQMAEIK